jgi:hypothetical protein
MRTEEERQKPQSLTSLSLSLRSGVLDSYVLFDGEVDAAWPQSSALSRRLDLVLVDSVDLRFAQAG